MRSTIRVASVVVAVCAGLVASGFTAFAPAPGHLPAADRARRAGGQFAPAADCSPMQASNIAWVTLDSDHHIDKQVSTYASGTNRITPVFQVNCVPTNATIVSVFSLNGQTIWTDQEKLPGLNFPRLYGYALETRDGSPLSDGAWGVQYFNDKTLLTSGSVFVGNTTGDPSQTTGVTVQGNVTDQASGQPIEGARIDVLNPGTQAEDFIRNGEPESDIFAVAKSDSQGAFTLNKKLARHTVYSVLAQAVAQGYKPIANNTFQILDDPDPVSLTIAMTK